MNQIHPVVIHVIVKEICSLIQQFAFHFDIDIMMRNIITTAEAALIDRVRWEFNFSLIPGLYSAAISSAILSRRLNLNLSAMLKKHWKHVVQYSTSEHDVVDMGAFYS